MLSYGCVTAIFILLYHWYNPSQGGFVSSLFCPTHDANCPIGVIVASMVMQTVWVAELCVADILLDVIPVSIVLGINRELQIIRQNIEEYFQQIIISVGGDYPNSRKLSTVEARIFCYTVVMVLNDPCHYSSLQLQMHVVLRHLS
jgi:hypothetical protein